MTERLASYRPLETLLRKLPPPKWHQLVASPNKKNVFFWRLCVLWNTVPMKAYMVKERVGSRQCLHGQYLGAIWSPGLKKKEGKKNDSRSTWWLRAWPPSQGDHAPPLWQLGHCSAACNMITEIFENIITFYRYLWHLLRCSSCNTVIIWKEPPLPPIRC